MTPNRRHFLAASAAALTSSAVAADEQKQTQIRPNRIGIDTGAYVTGRLTCLVLEKDQQRFLHVGGRDA